MSTLPDGTALITIEDVEKALNFLALTSPELQLPDGAAQAWYDALVGGLFGHPTADRLASAVKVAARTYRIPCVADVEDAIRGGHVVDGLRG